MSKDRLLDLCNNTIVWADEHSSDLASDLIKGMGITKKYETESQLIYWSKIFLQKSLTKKSKIIVFN